MKLKDIQEQFDQREIKPSSEGWDQLAQRLDREENKKSINWLYYAGATAAILALILLVFPLNKGSKTVPTEEIVNEKVDQPVENVPFGNPPVHNEDFQSEAVNEVFALSENELNDTTGTSDSMMDRADNISIRREPVAQIFDSRNLQAERMEVVIQPTTVGIPQTYQPDEAEILLTEAMQQLDSSIQYQYYVNPDRLLQEIEIDIAMEKDRKVESGLLRGLEFTVREIYSAVRGTN